jgi:hypothetical protein
LRPRLATGLPFSHRTRRMRLYAHIITNGRRIRNDFESAGGSFFEISIVFPNLICVWGANFAQRTWLPRQSGPKKPHRAGPLSAGVWGAGVWDAQEEEDPEHYSNGEGTHSDSVRSRPKSPKHHQ